MNPSTEVSILHVYVPLRFHPCGCREEGPALCFSTEEISRNLHFFPSRQQEVFYQLHCLNSYCAFCAAIPFSAKEQLHGDKEAADLSLNREVC